MRLKTAKDLMNVDVLTVEDQMTAEDLAAFFEENEISGAPVVDGDGRLLGVVSLKDLARSVPGSGNAAPDRSDPALYLKDWEDQFNPEDLKPLRVVDTEVTAGDLMSRTIHSVSASTPIAECARKMLENHVHRLLVTEDGQLRGILTSFDVLRLVADL